MIEKEELDDRNTSPRAEKPCECCMEGRNNDPTIQANETEQDGTEDMYNTSEKTLQCDQCAMFLPTNSNFTMYKTKNSVRQGKSAENIKGGGKEEDQKKIVEGEEGDKESMTKANRWAR